MQRTQALRLLAQAPMGGVSSVEPRAKCSTGAAAPAQDLRAKLTENNGDDPMRQLTKSPAVLAVCVLLAPHRSAMAPK